MKIISVEELTEYARIDIDQEDEAYQKELHLLDNLIEAAQEYLVNATGKDYPETDNEGKPIPYNLEKIYLQMLISYWYEKRSPVGSTSEDFSYSTRSIMLQLKNK